jgi:hypothetical protein
MEDDWDQHKRTELNLGLMQVRAKVCLLRRLLVRKLSSNAQIRSYSITASQVPRLGRNGLLYRMFRRCGRDSGLFRSPALVPILLDACRSDDAPTRAALTLGIAILEGGNRAVRDNMLCYGERFFHSLPDVVATANR